MNPLCSALCVPRQAPRRARIQVPMEAVAPTEPMGIKMPGKWARRGYATLGIVMALPIATLVVVLGILLLGFVVFPE